jgi:endonuclease YncB( thermonuclease family)
MRALWAFIAVVAFSATVAAEPVEWKVVSVHDGDTLTAVDAANVQHKVRLQGIDAPEVKQAFGTKARDRLADLTLRKVVRVNVHEHDRYGRLLADIEAGGQSVNRRMVADGMAWHYSRYSKDAGLAAAEREARAARRGLWADKAPTPPWEWRAGEQNRTRKPAGSLANP